MIVFTYMTHIIPKSPIRELKKLKKRQEKWLMTCGERLA